jgi:hypothetical protein
MITEEEKLIVYLKHQPYMTWYDVEEEVKSYYIHIDPKLISFSDWIEKLYQENKTENYIDLDIFTNY